MTVAHQRSVIGVLDPRSGGRQVRYLSLDLAPTTAVTRTCFVD
jgi:hypothetical protein